MQQTTGVAVLATELPATDRRALSQAWYSALHLAERTPRAGSASHQPAGSANGGASGFAHDARPAQGAAHSDGASARGMAQRAASARRDASATHDTSVRARRHGAGAPRDRSEPLAERRAPKSELAGRIERALAQRGRGMSASFALSAAGGRVRLLVRSDGARTRVVAVCAPPLRERVERALAQARFALAARGASVRAEVA